MTPGVDGTPRPRKEHPEGARRRAAFGGALNWVNSND
jgi:hypothetical protein